MSPVVETSRGFYLLKLEQRVAAGELETIARRTLARRLAARFTADEIIKQFGTELLARAQAGEKLEAVTEQLVASFLDKRAAARRPKLTKGETDPALESPARPKVDISAPFGLGANPITDALPSEAVAAKAFDLEKPDDLHPKLIETRSGVALMQLKEKETATREDFAKDKDEVLRALREQKRLDAVRRYVAALRKAAGDRAKIDARFAEEPKGEGRDEG
jgi:peptidyl-prolyl cis-trans isomerase D